MPVFSTNLNASNLTIPPTTTMEAHIAANNPHPNYLLVSDLKSAVNTQITVSELKDVVVGSSALQGTILQFKGAAYVPVTINEALSGFELPIATEQSRGIIQLAVYNDITSKDRVKAVTPYLLDTYVSTRIALEDADIRNYINIQLSNVNVSVDSATTQRYGITKLATQADVVAKVASTVITPNLMVNYVNSVLSAGLPPEVIRATTIDYGIVRLAAEADTTNPTEDPDAVVTVGNYADKINVGVVRLAQSNDIVAAVTSTAVTPDLVSTYVSAVHSTINSHIANVSAILDTSINTVSSTLETSISTASANLDLTIVNVSSALNVAKQDKLLEDGLHTSITSTVNGPQVNCLLTSGTNISINETTHAINCTLDVNSILNTFTEGMLKGLINCTVQKQTYTKNSTKTACMGTYMNEGYIKFPFLKYTYTDPNNANIKKEYCLALIWGQHTSTYGKATDHYDTIEINIAGYYKLIRVIMPVLHYVGTAAFDISKIPLNKTQAGTQASSAYESINTHDNDVHYVRANHVKNIGESVSDVDDYAPIESFTYFMTMDDDTAYDSYTITWFLLGLTPIVDDIWNQQRLRKQLAAPTCTLEREYRWGSLSGDTYDRTYTDGNDNYAFATGPSGFYPGNFEVSLPVGFEDKYYAVSGDHARSQQAISYVFDRALAYEDDYDYHIKDLVFVGQSYHVMFYIKFNDLCIKKVNGELVIDMANSDIEYDDNFIRTISSSGVKSTAVTSGCTFVHPDSENNPGVLYDRNGYRTFMPFCGGSQSGFNNIQNLFVSHIDEDQDWIVLEQVSYDANTFALTKFTPQTETDYIMSNGVPKLSTWDYSHHDKFGRGNRPPGTVVSFYTWADLDKDWIYRLHFIMGYTDSQIIFKIATGAYYQDWNFMCTRIIWSLPDAVTYEVVPKVQS